MVASMELAARAVLGCTVLKMVANSAAENAAADEDVDRFNLAVEEVVTGGVGDGEE